MKHEKQICGLYYRLSQEDERNGESLSIENQRNLLRKYAEEHRIEVYDEYIDDGVSGTTFDRPEVQRLLDDAKNGVINTIIVKDLSRFGRNYIEVGRYLDYVFPAFGIRFIAIQDNVDTANRDSNTDMMMPIMNVFNEWHAANTSKKIRAVKKANAKEGIYTAKKAAYGYIMGTDKKRTPTIDEEAAPVVRRIFEMYASGISPQKIAEILSNERVPSPGAYAYQKYGQKNKPTATMLFWHPSTVRDMLKNIIYIGHMPQLRWTSLSYKNHKRFRKDESEWTVVYNNHQPLISQELWDRVRARQKSVAQGRKTKRGYTHPLSGFLFCADCGHKMRMGTRRTKNGSLSYHFNCGYYERYGKHQCYSHYMSGNDLEKIVLEDIQAMAKYLTVDEQSIRNEFERYNSEMLNGKTNTEQKELKVKRKRVEELDNLMQVVYEDKVKGKIPEELCLQFLEKYSSEQKTLEAEISALEERIKESEKTAQNVDEFIRNVKKYLQAPELTREMCYELIDRIVIGSLPKDKDAERKIEIVYKVDIASVLRHKFKRQ